MSRDYINALTSNQSLAFNLHKEGMTFRQIAKQMKVCDARARQLCAVAERKLLADLHWTSGLSSLVRGVLLDLNIASRTEAKLAYGVRLRPFKIRKYGWGSHVELAKWLGLPEPQKSKRGPRPTICPHCGKYL